MESLKKQKVSPAAEPAGAESLKKRKVSPAAEPAADFPDTEMKGTYTCIPCSSVTVSCCFRYINMGVLCRPSS